MARARARARNSAGDNSPEDSANEDERGTDPPPAPLRCRTYVPASVRSCRAVEAATRGDKKPRHGRKVGDFSAARLGPAEPPRAGSMNLCDNFRQEPNAERSGYYISPWKSAKRGSLSFGRHRRDVTGGTREIYRAALLRLDLRCS